MAHLLDTNVLVRLANATDPEHDIAAGAVLELHQRGEVLHITPQVLIEFRNVATRPVAANGLGLSPMKAEAQADEFEAIFPLLPDTSAIYPAWKALVEAVGVIGKQVHDARIVAVCHAHSITHLLTFNIGHFSRMAAFGPGLIPIHPAAV